MKEIVIFIFENVIPVALLLSWSTWCYKVGYESRHQDEASRRDNPEENQTQL
jgi:hypothetical protein